MYMAAARPSTVRVKVFPRFPYFTSCHRSWGGISNYVVHFLFGGWGWVCSCAVKTSLRGAHVPLNVIWSGATAQKFKESNGDH